MRLGAQPFLWKWVLFAWEWKMISISKAEHLPSFWNRGPVELGSGLSNKYPTRVPTRNSSSNSSFGLKRPPTLFHGFSMSFIQITCVFSGKIRYKCALLKHLTFIVNPQLEYYSNRTYFPGAWKILWVLLILLLTFCWIIWAQWLMGRHRSAW